MKNTDDKYWEDGWRETLAEHESKPTMEDWSGMKHLIETQIAQPAQALSDPKVPRLPDSFIGRFLRFWPQSLLALILVGSLGFGLGQCRADDITDEILGISEEADIPVDFSKEATMPTDDDRLTPPRPRCTPGPDYIIRTYRAFDENGRATGKLENDTLFFNRDVGDEGHLIIRTSTPTYRFDTIYELDDLGNLTQKIYSIDSVIVNGGKIPGLQ